MRLTSMLSQATILSFIYTMKYYPSSCIGESYTSDFNPTLRANKLPSQVRRSLIEGKHAITLLDSSKGVQTVRISQVFFGTQGICEEEPENQAELFFATYLDPDSLEPICGFIEKNVGGCFQKTVAIGCHPKTKKAVINLYLRDEALSEMPFFLYAKNPQVGRCRIGKSDIARNTLKITESFDCIPRPPSGPGTCSDMHDKCLSGTFCVHTEQKGYFCKPYEKVGSTCGGFRLPGGAKMCNPDEAYCINRKVCLVFDAMGICASYLGDCKIDMDCGDKAYCDQSVGKCKEKLSAGECCSTEGNQCTNGTCELVTDVGYRCLSYASIGDTCGGPLAKDQCNPNEAFCNECGKCAAYLGFCQLGDDCGPDAYCDNSSARCKPRPQEGECCTIENDLCQKGTYCNFTKSNGSTCKAFVPIGADCEGKTEQGEDNKCNPIEAYCFSSDSCQFADLPGSCLAYYGKCRTDDECTPDQYCDQNLDEPKCKARLREGDCCYSEHDRCLEGLECREWKKHMSDEEAVPRCLPLH